MEAEGSAGAFRGPDEAFAGGLCGKLALPDGSGFGGPAGFLGALSLRFGFRDAISLVPRGAGFETPLDE